ncbi:MAG: amino acid ABC transporter permease [Oscillospiraceae bacterium]|nr:amino acid ABC transporter permease [Oscillospiraceae bacterium]
MSAFQRIMTADNLSFMLRGAGYSLLIAVFALIGGSVLGLLAAVLKMSKHKIPRIIANIYVEVIRGTPMMLQILLLYLGGPVITKALFHFVYTPNPVLVGTIAVGINSGAYTTELFRSAIQSVDKGQWEAAKTIGLSYSQTMKEVILPQAFKRILPPYINEFIVLIKDSSLLASIGAVELLHSADVLGAKFYNYLIPLLCATVMYLVMTLTISHFARKLERRLAESD